MLESAAAIKHRVGLENRDRVREQVRLPASTAVAAETKDEKSSAARNAKNGGRVFQPAWDRVKQSA
jgi:hypothetical protein